MVPMGISWAALVRVGQAAGRNNLSQVRRSARASIILALGYIMVASSLFAGFPHTWARLYTNDPSVVAAAAPIFLICGILDWRRCRLIYASALTGLGDTRSPLIVNALWYWALGMPLSYWLTFHNGMEVEGLWLGRAIAAIGSGANLALLWHARMRTASASHQRTRLTLLTSLHARESPLMRFHDRLPLDRRAFQAGRPRFDMFAIKRIVGVAVGVEGVEGLAVVFVQRQTKFYARANRDWHK